MSPVVSFALALLISVVLVVQESDSVLLPSTLRRTNDGPCANDTECLNEFGLVCNQSICGCPTSPRSVWHAGLCKGAETVQSCNPAANARIRECPSYETFHCHPIDHLCACHDRMIWSWPTQTCKLRAVESCLFEDGIPYHDICASGHCATDGRCACPDVNGVVETWSADPGVGCVEDFYNFTGTNNEDCRHRNFSTNRTGLTNVDMGNRCLCETGLTYFQGYCVTATLTLDQSCVQGQLEPTCDIGRGLTCVNTPQRGNRCVCLPKVMYLLGGTYTLLRLNWNRILNRCDLRETGEGCNAGYQCITGFCTAGRCSFQGSGHRSGPYAVSLMLIAIILIIFNYHL